MSNSTQFLPANADSLARLHTAEAMGTVVSIMRGDIGCPKAAALQLKAAETVLDRGHGRAVQAVISVPARQAVAAKLASLSDDALLQIAMSERGVPEQNEGPSHQGFANGTILDPNGHLPDGQGPVDEADLPDSIRHKPFSSQELADVTDAEIDEGYDPCS